MPRSATDPNRLRPGNRVDRYEITELLDQGANWAIYAARDSELGRDIAIELVRAPDPETTEAHARLREAAQAMASLSHPNLVAIHDIGTDGDDLFIATERLDGRTLRDWLEQPRRWPDVVAMFVLAGRGLAALHAAGLVHLDVDLDCLRLGASGQVRVGKLALARILEQGADGACADQLAYCTALDHALAGARGRAVPDRIRRAVARGMAADPAARWPSVDALVAELAPRRRRWWPAAAVAVALAAGVAATTAWYVRGRPDDPVISSAAPDVPATWKPVRIARDLMAGPTTAAAISHDGATLAFGGGSSLWTQARGDPHRRLLPVPPGAGIAGLRFSPDGRALFLSVDGRTGWEIWRLDLAGPTQLRRIASVDGQPFVDSSADGSRLLVSNDEQLSAVRLGLLEVDVQTGAIRTLLPPSEEPIRMAVWSPDGASIACLRTAKFRVDLLLVDAAGAEIRRLKAYRVLSERLAEVVWRSPESLLLVVEMIAGQSSRSVVTEVGIAGGILGDSHELYSSPEYTALGGPQLAGGEAFFELTSWARRTMVLDLHEAAGARQPRFLDSGSRSDDFLTGWTESGRLILPADMSGNLDAFEMDLAGRIHPLLATWWDDSPSIVLGNDVWLPTFTAGDPAPVCTLTRRTGERTEALAEPACVWALCAGHRRRPCLSVRGTEASRRYYRWDPDTGRSGAAPIATMELAPGDRASALSLDGKKLAQARSAGYVEIIVLATGASRRVAETAPPAVYQYVSWGENGQILATRIGERQELVRIDPDGTVTEIFSSPNLWLAHPRLSHDGRYIALTATNLDTTYWTTPL